MHTHHDVNVDNMYCGRIRRGDVFLYEKKPGELLPVVVIQDSVLNEGLPTVMCAHIELGRQDDGVVTEVSVKKQESGLQKDGVCALHHVDTIDRRLMITKKGELSKETLQAIFQAFDIVLGRFRDV